MVDETPEQKTARIEARLAQLEAENAKLMTERDAVTPLAEPRMSSLGI